MIYDKALLQAIDALPPHEFQSEVWRITLGSNPPIRPNTRGARWNPPGTAAIYTSLEADTAVAEVRNLLATQPVPASVLLTLHKIEVELQPVIDLRAPEQLASLGVGEDELVSSNLAPCQVVGGASAWLGRAGLLVPSARAEGANLVIFVNEIDPEAGLDVVSSEPVVLSEMQ